MAKKGTTKFESNLQERNIAKDIGGRPVIASGALWGSKGDVRNDICLVEAKTTKKSQYRLTLKTWEKIRKEAISDGLRIPVFVVDLESSKYQIAVVDNSFFPNNSFYKDLVRVEVLPESVLITADSHATYVVGNYGTRLHIFPYELLLEQMEKIYG